MADLVTIPLSDTSNQLVPVAVKIPRYIAGTLTFSYFEADAVMDERHEDRVMSTEHPVEQGPSVTDHAYRAPSHLTLTYAWAMASAQNTALSQSFLQDMYTLAQIALANLDLCTVATGKRVYKNMLIEALDVSTDYERENILELRIGLKEIIFANISVTPLAISTTPLAYSTVAEPEKHAPVVKNGQVSPVPGYKLNQQIVNLVQMGIPVSVPGGGSRDRSRSAANAYQSNLQYFARRSHLPNASPVQRYLAAVGGGYFGQQQQPAHRRNPLGHRS